MKPVACLTRSIKGGSFEKKNLLCWLSVRFLKIILYLALKSFISNFLFYIVSIAQCSHFDHFTKIFHTRTEFSCLVQEIMPSYFFLKQF